MLTLRLLGAGAALLAAVANAEGWVVREGDCKILDDKNCISDNHPGLDYTDNMNCEFDYIGEATITTVEFEVDASYSEYGICVYDALEFNDVRYCADPDYPDRNPLPSSFEVSGTTNFQFYTDEGYNFKGFHLCAAPAVDPVIPTAAPVVPVAEPQCTELTESCSEGDTCCEADGLPAACLDVGSGEFQCYNCMSASSSRICGGIAGCMWDPEAEDGFGACAKKGDCDEEGKCCPAGFTCQRNDHDFVRACLNGKSGADAITCPPEVIPTAAPVVPVIPTAAPVVPVADHCVVADIVDADVADNVRFRYKDDRADLAGATVQMQNSRNGGISFFNWGAGSPSTFEGGFWVSDMWHTGLAWPQRLLIDGEVVHTWDTVFDAPYESCAPEVIPTAAPVVPVIPTAAPVVPVIPTAAPVVPVVSCADILDRKQCKRSPNCKFNKKVKDAQGKKGKCTSTDVVLTPCSEMSLKECRKGKTKRRCKIKKTKTKVNGKKIKTSACVDK